MKKMTALILALGFAATMPAMATEVTTGETTSVACQAAANRLQGDQRTSVDGERRTDGDDDVSSSAE